MIREFNRIPGCYWTIVIGIGLSPAARITELYLLTSPNSNSIGIFMEHPSSIAHATGLKDKEVDEALNELSRADRLYREAGNWVFVVPRWSFESGHDNLNNLKGALGLLKKSNHVLEKQFGETYPEFSTTLQRLVAEKWAKQNNGQSNGDANGVPDTVAVGV